MQVVSAVFVQQTMKMANSDEELAFRQKEKEKLDVESKVSKKAFVLLQRSSTTPAPTIPTEKSPQLQAEDCQLRQEGEEAFPAHG